MTEKHTPDDHPPLSELMDSNLKNVCAQRDFAREQNRQLRAIMEEREAAGVSKKFAVDFAMAVTERDALRAQNEKMRTAIESAIECTPDHKTGLITLLREALK